jgi:hypothetical protein
METWSQLVLDAISGSDLARSAVVRVLDRGVLG